MNIILIGMRGAGKTNVARRLAFMTKRPVMSSDTLIEYESGGQSIADFIATKADSWHAFRDLEYRVIKKISKMDGVIVDCGGGVIVDLDADGNEIYSNRKVKALKKSGTIVWLKGDIKRLVDKGKNKPERPSLDDLKSAEEIMNYRLPFYDKAADVVIDIEGKKRQDMADELFERFKGKL